jgi:hypothetical protein
MNPLYWKFQKNQIWKQLEKKSFNVYKLKHYNQTNHDNHNERKMKKWKKIENEEPKNM